jgi:hypothetical protein
MFAGSRPAIPMIPRLFLAIGVDIELAGLWLAMSSPTMPFGFARYGSDRSFAVIPRPDGEDP